MLDRIPGEVLDRFPGALLLVARSCQAAAMLAQRARIMERLGDAAKMHGTPALRHAVDAEIATDLVSDGNRASEAEALAHRVLDEAPTGELITRARALSVIGRATYWRREPDGQLSVAAMQDAGAYLAQAAKAVSRGRRPRGGRRARPVPSDVDRARPRPAAGGAGDPERGADACGPAPAALRVRTELRAPSCLLTSDATTSPRRPRARSCGSPSSSATGIWRPMGTGS